MDIWISYAKLQNKVKISVPSAMNKITRMNSGFFSPVGDLK
jgi:hypothetical protein